MNVSIIGLTWNRCALTKEVYTKNLSKTGTDDYELLVCDQGSTDGVKDFVKSLNPAYFRENKYNEGIARAFNQLMIRAKGRHIFMMGNDLSLPENWLKTIVEYADDIEKSGIIGFEGQELLHPQTIARGKSGKEYLINQPGASTPFDRSQIFGSILITQELLQTIGFFCEEFHPYGCEDSDFSFRARLAGFRNYYIPGLRSEHLMPKKDEDKTFNTQKEFCYFANLPTLSWRAHNYGLIGLYVPPPMCKPIVI